MTAVNERVDVGVGRVALRLTILLHAFDKKRKNPGDSTRMINIQQTLVQKTRHNHFILMCTNKQLTFLTDNKVESCHRHDKHAKVPPVWKSQSAASYHDISRTSSPTANNNPLLLGNPLRGSIRRSYTNNSYTLFNPVGIGFQFL